MHLDEKLSWMFLGVATGIILVVSVIGGLLVAFAAEGVSHLLGASSTFPSTGGVVAFVTSSVTIAVILWKKTGFYILCTPESDGRGG